MSETGQHKAGLASATPGRDRVTSFRSEVPDLLYILSPSYSGSTLLTFLLAAHPDIATVGELKASALGPIETYRCSCGSFLRECPFWLEVQEQMRERGGDFVFEDFGTHFRRGPKYFRNLISLGARHPLLASLSSFALQALPNGRRRLDGIVEQNRRLIEVIANIQGGRVFLDGSKDPERLSQLLSRVGDDVKVVRLIRDGRGFVNSYMKHRKVNMKSAALEWLRTERACVRAVSGMAPGNVLKVRYEDVCADPREAMNRIFDFAGLSPSNIFGLSDVTQLHILGNAMRLNPDKSIEHDEKWKTQLRPVEVEEFHTIAGCCNRQHGYF